MKWPIASVRLLILAGVIVCAGQKTELPPVALKPVETQVRYDFEDSIVTWVAQDYIDSRACTQVLRSRERAKQGEFALKLMIDLRGGHPNLSKGEAWVDMRTSPPAGVRAPLDLTGKTVTIWAYAPVGAQGDPSRPNGFQVFVKDSTWKGEYGPWQNIVEGVWVPVTLKVSTTQPAGGWMAPGFDPSRIIAVGFKVGAGGGSTKAYKGVLWIDAVGW